MAMRHGCTISVLKKNGIWFASLQLCLECRRFHDIEEVQMAVREWLRMQESDFHCDEILKLAKRR